MQSNCTNLHQFFCGFYLQEWKKLVSPIKEQAKQMKKKVCVCVCSETKNIKTWMEISF